MTNKLPAFKGKPLIEIPEFIPTAEFLGGDFLEFGKAVLKEYQGRAKADYRNAPALNVLSYDHGVVKGSNPFAVVLVNQIVSGEGLRTATHADLERALKINALPLRGQYEDTGLVLRSEDAPNEYLAKNLMAQVRARNPNAKMPAMIFLSELELIADANSPHQLGFKLKDSARVFYDLSVLNNDGNFSSEDIDEKTGLPNKTGNNGNRHLYTRKSGLSGLYLYWNLDANSYFEHLANSNGYGRVVIVSAEGASQNFSYNLTRIGNASDKAIAQAFTETNLAIVASIIGERNTKNLLEILRKSE